MNVPESMINYKKIFEINKDIEDMSYDIVLSNHVMLNQAMNRSIGGLSALRDRMQDILIDRYPFVWDSLLGENKGVYDGCL